MTVERFADIGIPKSSHFPAVIIEPEEYRGPNNKTFQTSASTIEKKYPAFLRQVGLVEEVSDSSEREFDGAELGQTVNELVHNLDAVNNLLVMGRTGEKVSEVFPNAEPSLVTDFSRVTKGIKMPSPEKRGYAEKMYETFRGRGERYLEMYTDSIGPGTIALPGFDVPDPLTKRGFVMSEETKGVNQRIAMQWARKVSNPGGEFLYRPESYTLREILVVMNIRPIKTQISVLLDSLTFPSTDRASLVEAGVLRLGTGMITDAAEEEGRLRYVQLATFAAEKLVTQYFKGVPYRRNFKRGSGATVEVREKDFDTYSQSPVKFYFRYLGDQMESMPYNFSDPTIRAEFFDWLYMIGKSGRVYFG